MRRVAKHKVRVYPAEYLRIVRRARKLRRSIPETVEIMLADAHERDKKQKGSGK